MPRYDIRQAFSSLPRFNKDDVDADTLNRLVRTIEQNLFQLDLNVVPSYTTTERNSRKFSPGGLIFNTTVEVHQAYDGNAWRNLYLPVVYPTGMSLTSSIGTVTVVTS